MREKNLIVYFAKSLRVVIGLVLVWRGIWYVLDGFDYLVFGGSHIVSSIGGVIAGLALLYIPDGDLKEIEKL